MSSPKAEPGAAAPHTIATLAALLSPARAEASRRNGAMSHGPKTPEGKARSAQNALKHGLRSKKHVVLPGESGAEFAALEAALLEELAPEGALSRPCSRGGSSPRPGGSSAPSGSKQNCSPRTALRAGVSGTP